MIVLPIIERELRVAARRAATYRTRFGAGIAATILLAWANLIFSWQALPRVNLGQSLFRTISGLAFAYCLLIGARVTADCISEEKRDGTLGLLFLTDLKGWNVIFGKFVANSLNSIYGLFAILPLLAIPLLIGGVTFSQVGQMALVLVNTLFFSLSIGILVSTLSRNDRKSMFSTLFVVFSITCAPILWLLYWMFVAERIQNATELQAAATTLLGTPVWSFGYVLWPGFSSWRIPWSPPAWTFWSSVAIVHLFGWMALLGAGRILPFVWRDRPRERKVGVKSPAVRVPKNFSERQLEWRKRLLEINPFWWLLARNRFKVYYPWLFLVALAGTWVWGYVQYGDIMFDKYPAIPTALLIHGFFKVWILSEASYRFVEDHQSGALEMLLSTPLSMEKIVKGQFLALRRQFAWPLVMLAAAELIVFHGWFSLPVIAAGLVILVADVVTLVWAGMYLGLSGKNMNRVVSLCVLLVLLMPWAAYVLAVGLWDALFAGTDRYARILFSSRVGLWFGIGLITDFLLVMYWVRPGLKNRLAALAFRGVEESSGLKSSWPRRWARKIFPEAAAKECSVEG